jgi:tetratricopeptide (TPR) repeat protein
MSMSAELSDFDALWDYDDPAATERAFRALLPSAPADRSYLAQLLTQIARAEGLQRKFAEAHATLDTAQRLIDRGHTQAQIRYLLERGRVFNSSKQVDQAWPLFLEAWELAAAQRQDLYAIDAAHMLAIVAPPDQKLVWNLKALALAERAPDPRARKWMGSLYNNIGWAYHEQGEYERALELFQKALNYREAQGGAPEIRVARWCVGRALRSLGRLAEAQQIQQVLLREIEHSGATDGYVFEELAECALALGQTNEAKKYFARAYAELSQDPWLAESEPERLRRLKELGVES